MNIQQLSSSEGVTTLLPLHHRRPSCVPSPCQKADGMWELREEAPVWFYPISRVVKMNLSTEAGGQWDRQWPGRTGAPVSLLSTLTMNFCQVTLPQWHIRHSHTYTHDACLHITATTSYLLLAVVSPSTLHNISIHSTDVAHGYTHLSSQVLVVIASQSQNVFRSIKMTLHFNIFLFSLSDYQSNTSGLFMLLRGTQWRYLYERYCEACCDWML